MKLGEMTWMQVEEYLEADDRVVLPLGSTEQHAYLSVATDAILAERVAVDAAEPLGVPVCPVLPYGISPYFMAYPGTLTFRVEIYRRIVEDLLDSLAESGFRRILIVNGHGGNAPAREVARHWDEARGDIRVRFHDWWSGPRFRAAVEDVDPEASHASWAESFPWTRVDGASPPEEPKAPVDASKRHELSPGQFRELLGDGSFGGLYRRDDELMEELWQVAVEETRELLAEPWGEEAEDWPEEASSSWRAPEELGAEEHSREDEEE